MGKKRTRSSQTSKGERSNISKSVTKMVKQGRSEIERAMNKIQAWRAGKNPWITVPGPSKKEAFVRVRANALYGDPRYAMANIFKTRGEE